MLLSRLRLSFSLFSLCSLGALNLCAAQTDDVLCRGGNGKFDASFHHEVKVHIGAAKIDGLATRTCEAILSSGWQEVSVASRVSEVDLDAFGTDLGLDVPVATFQVKKSEFDCYTTYLIYSLQNPPRLLRTLTGGSAFQVSDLDLDGRVEIWTDDAAAIDGLDKLTLSDFEFLPSLVLRFENDRLLDVGAEFRPYFDQRIAKVKSQIDSQDLKDFKNTHGKLGSGTFPPEVIHRLRKAKVGVLEIVWTYLYSGRQREAWTALKEMWPSADFERIQAAIVSARDRGILAQTNGAGSAGTAHKRKRATIYDVTMSQGDESEIASPQPILLRRPPPSTSEQASQKAEILLDLIIDSAGKVRFAKSTTAADPELLQAALGWKFIPAQRGKHAVASRTHLAVSLRR
jgi:hypothetical protein